ncbi:MAG: DUF3667 domain-containing protein [bacterium]
MNPAAVDVQPVQHRATYTAPVTQSPECLNCGTSLTGPFCASCGQRDIPPYPSVRELAIDAFWELSGWDGRFAATVRTLVFKPGFLTIEFLQGRRARYLSPLRLYLMASLAYFVLQSAAPQPQKQIDAILPVANATVVPGVRTPSRPERIGNAVKMSLAGKGAGLSPEDKAWALENSVKAPLVLRPLIRRMIEDPVGFRRGFVETIPRMLFALLPVFAAIVACLYRGRKYPEHLYFAIHLNVFLFFVFSLGALISFARMPGLSQVLETLMVVFWIPWYSTVAFRRVYGGSIPMTLVKEVVVAGVYGFACLVGLVGVVYWVSLFG